MLEEKIYTPEHFLCPLLSRARSDDDLVGLLTLGHLGRKERRKSPKNH